MSRSVIPRSSLPAQKSLDRGDTSVAASAVTPDELTVESATLLQGRQTLNIRHQGRIYRLQKTKQGKLILTK